MSTVHYFQRYQKKENVHSSSACLLLYRLYTYSSKRFYEVLSSFFGVEVDDLKPGFVLQDKETGNDSIPDFSVTQPGFKIAVEAKERAGTFKMDQLKEHANNLINERSKYKFLVLLCPSFDEKDKKTEQELRDAYKGEILVHRIKYIDFYKKIRDVLTEIKDDEMIEIVEDYYEYCQEEKLFDLVNETMMVRLSGQTMKHNVDNNLYYDKGNSKWNGFRYLGLYADKQVKYVGQIKSVYRVIGSGQTIENLSGHYSIEDIETIKKSLKETNGSDRIYYLVDHFERIDSFAKVTPRALYGKKKFHLTDYKVKPGSSAKEVAEGLSGQTW